MPAEGLGTSDSGKMSRPQKRRAAGWKVVPGGPMACRRQAVS